MPKAGGRGGSWLCCHKLSSLGGYARGRTDERRAIPVNRLRCTDPSKNGLRLVAMLILNPLNVRHEMHDGKPAMMNRAVLALIQASQIQARVRPVAKRSVMRAAR